VHLKRLGKEFYYYKDEKCHGADFVIPADKTVIQVCYELNASNTERELSGLVAAAENIKAKKLIILTLEQEQELQHHNWKVEIKPAWRWLLE
jgi:hypothetical protein